jgi:hypothetical protein
MHQGPAKEKIRKKQTKEKTLTKRKKSQKEVFVLGQSH